MNKFFAWGIGSMLLAMMSFYNDHLRFYTNYLGMLQFCAARTPKLSSTRVEAFRPGTGSPSRGRGSSGAGRPSC